MPVKGRLQHLSVTSKVTVVIVVVGRVVSSSEMACEPKEIVSSTVSVTCTVAVMKRKTTSQSQ